MRWDKESLLCKFVGYPASYPWPSLGYELGIFSEFANQYKLTRAHKAEYA